MKLIRNKADIKLKDVFSSKIMQNRSDSMKNNNKPHDLAQNTFAHKFEEHRVENILIPTISQPLKNTALSSLRSDSRSLESELEIEVPENLSPLSFTHK